MVKNSRDWPVKNSGNDVWDNTVKSRFYVIVGQHHMQRKIEIYRKIEKRYLVNSEFGHQTFQSKFEISKIEISLYLLYL